MMLLTRDRLKRSRNLPWVRAAVAVGLIGSIALVALASTWALTTTDSAPKATANEVVGATNHARR